MVEKASRVLRDKLPQVARTTEAEIQPAFARTQVQQPLSRAAALRQSHGQSRWYSTTQTIKTGVRQYSSSSNARSPRAGYSASRTARAVGQQTSRVPFASTLRPSLTGGTLGRTAGGYGTGAGRVGGVRYFSHSPAAPAEVVSNVSQAVRAFWLSGKKARFDGINPRTGEKRFRAISALHEEASQKMSMHNAQAPGSYLDFKVSPTITAIGPLSRVPGSSNPDETTLNCDGVMEMLSVDFARALKDLAAIMNDLKRLATLGDLPISLVDQSTLRVRFPGCDADLVEALCKELGVRRGFVHQDADFDQQAAVEMALLFPYAPSKAASEVMRSPSVRAAKRRKRMPLEWQEMLSPDPSENLSQRSTPGHELEDIEIVENPWLSSPSNYSSLHDSEQDPAVFFESTEQPRETRVSDYEGLEGIYRFLEQCDKARR